MLWPRNGSLKFENVFLKYEGSEEYALKNFSLEIESGKKVKNEQEMIN